MPGTPAFDQFVVLAKTIVDPADPLNAIHAGVNASVPPTRKIYIQYIEGDEFVVNASTVELIAAGSRTAIKPFTDFFRPPPNFPGPARHGFFLSPAGDLVAGTMLTASAQSRMHTFLITGTQPMPVLQ